ncbi:hypothetical protein GCM10022224_041930 [Nonomuraea antimicrobica]|uniref:Uncharacterized protein n=2 Tax=Nonomuraea antimicrobica TaxID=561173 RepID=A0ABP7C0I3_9ACTN
MYSGDATPASVITELKKMITAIETGINDDLAAHGVEIAGLRHQINDCFTSAHNQVLERFDSLRIDLMHLKLILEQQLKSSA